MIPLQFCDLYCGAGGTSSGIKEACAAKGYDYRLIGLNHWDKAIATHRANGLGRAEEANIYITNPHWAVPGGHLDLLCASPECVYHSRARVGRGPCDDQSRSAAHDLLRWIDCLDVDWLQVENVSEFVDWGPLDDEGNPIKELAGVLFYEWLEDLTKRGYKYEYKILNSADYGAYTARKRFFLIATKTGKKIPWPEKTHEGNYRAARDIIDWSISGQSVFLQKNLVRNSMNRICHGLKKFNGIELDLDYAMECVSNKVLPKVRYREPYPFLARYNGGKVPRVHSVDNPLGTVDTRNRFAVAEPYFVENYGQSRSADMNKPLSAITVKPKSYVAEPFLYPQQQGWDKKNVQSIYGPMPTIATAGCEGLIQPFLTKYYSTGKGAVSVEEPLATITTKDRFSLIQPAINQEMYLDVLYRMMQVHELSAAMGFPTDYRFIGGTTAAKRQIGNAVEVNTARALVSAILEVHCG